jgi:hypothetical protein
VDFWTPWEVPLLATDGAAGAALTAIRESW